MTLNLHELINQPGYGKANEAVKEAGMWRRTPIELMNHAYFVACHIGITDVADLIDEALFELEAEEPQQ